MTRQTCQAYELNDDTYVFHNGKVEKIVKAYSIFDKTTIIDGNGDSWRISSLTSIELAGDEEVAEYQRELDRLRVAEALVRLSLEIRSRKLPVPRSLSDVVIGLDLPDDADLSAWAEVLRARPVKARTSLIPSIDSDEFGVGVRVFGGSSGEFGPDLGDTVEHRDSVGAFAVVGKPRAINPDPDLPMNDTVDDEPFPDETRGGDDTGDRAEENAPERDGWSVSDGHRPPVDDEAMRADRYNGEAGA